MLKVKNISKIFNSNGKRIQTLQNINTEVEKGSLVVLLGPTGCGKTTLLKIIARLIKPTTGSIEFNGNKIGVIFQHYNLFPWLNVRKNIEFGLKFKKIGKVEKKKKINELLEIIGLQKFESFYPHELSGGMQQRVAIARTLAINPDLLLMDEPFGALDAHTKGKMQEFVLALQKKTKKTIIFVTHNIEEAIFLADKIYILSEQPGKVIKVIDNPIKNTNPSIKRDKSFLFLEHKIMKIMKNAKGEFK